MIAARRSHSRRYAREQTPEEQSEAQFRARLAEVGWPRDRLGRDLGEDILVRIYDDGVSTGLTFHVQLKSAATLEMIKRKKRSPFPPDRLACRLEVKDLLRWEASAVLVVLVVWDVEDGTGWWRPIPEIVGELDEAHEGWREQRTVAVTVSMENRTDDKGLRRLRSVVADHDIPLVPKQEPMGFFLVFEETEEGMAAARALERALDMGEGLTSSESAIPRIRFPAQHRRIHGPEHPDRPINLEFTPTPAKATKVLRIEADSPEGAGILPHVELRATTQGRERLVLTNEHQMAPVVFRFEPGEPRAGFSFEQVRRGDTVYEAREATIFMLAAGHPAGVIRLIDPESGELVLSVASARGEATNYDLTATRRWRDLLDKLFFIQQHVARHGSLSLEDFAKDPAGEAYMTESLFSILRDRRREVTETISFEMTPTEPALPQSKANVFIDSKCSASLLSLDIPLGSVKKTVLDADRFLAACRAARDEAVATGEPVRVRLEGMKIIEEYIDLIHEDAPWSIMYEAFDRLSRSSAVHEGYFSRADARAAGVSDAVFDALVGEHKAEQVALDVFHLTHFPRSDHEELVTLWLQTDRRGVISHDTALLIHELSDILPRRRHITVPPGWDPGARKLGNKVVLHHAEIGEHEIRWLGPVPYTAPLRTVRDCIEAHLSPDLVEQAIAEGITRGMFTEDELPPAVRRGAA